MVSNENIIQGGDNKMKLVIEKESSNLIIKLKGQLDLHTAQDFKNKVKKQLSNKINNIVLDLEAIDFIDSSGIGAILSLYKKIENKGGEVVIINMSPTLNRIFELSGVLKIIESYSSRRQALENLSRR